HLLLGLADPTREDRAAQRVRAGFEHRAGRREMVRETVVHEIAPAKAGGEQRSREAPVIGGAALRLVDRAGRGENAHCLAPVRRRESAEGPRRFLQLEELRLARDGSRASAARVVTAAGST